MNYPEWWKGKRDAQGRPLAAHKYDEMGIAAEQSWDMHVARERIRELEALKTPTKEKTMDEIEASLSATRQHRMALELFQRLMTRSHTDDLSDDTMAKMVATNWAEAKRIARLHEEHTHRVTSA